MGSDKALLPHPEGGTWLERTLLLLATQRQPITLLSRWPEHGRLAQAMNLPALDILTEPPPWEGPLLALHRLMERHPQQRLLVCPVDMPHLQPSALEQLVAAAATQPLRIHVAHDGQRCQPLLGIYPNHGTLMRSLAATVHQGERRLQTWLAGLPYQAVPLEAQQLRNINRPDQR
jgi:molybdopterin-guanine dinucleotide biosynthesis protein A